MDLVHEKNAQSAIQQQSVGVAEILPTDKQIVEEGYSSNPLQSVPVIEEKPGYSSSSDTSHNAADPEKTLTGLQGDKGSKIYASFFSYITLFSSLKFHCRFHSRRTTQEIHITSRSRRNGLSPLSPAFLRRYLQQTDRAFH
jgi:hypothetical protein